MDKISNVYLFQILFFIGWALLLLWWEESFVFAVILIFSSAISFLIWDELRLQGR
jgi:hypothetical protein